MKFHSLVLVLLALQSRIVFGQEADTEAVTTETAVREVLEETTTEIIKVSDSDNTTLTTGATEQDAVELKECPAIKNYNDVLITSSVFSVQPVQIVQTSPANNVIRIEYNVIRETYVRIFQTNSCNSHIYLQLNVPRSCLIDIHIDGFVNSRLTIEMNTAAYSGCNLYIDNAFNSDIKWSLNAARHSILNLNMKNSTNSRIEINHFASADSDVKVLMENAIKNKLVVTQKHPMRSPIVVKVIGTNDSNQMEVKRTKPDIMSTVSCPVNCNVTEVPENTVTGGTVTFFGIPIVIVG